jgi:hypothetical protein
MRVPPILLFPWPPALHPTVLMLWIVLRLVRVLR